MRQRHSAMANAMYGNPGGGGEGRVHPLIHQLAHGPGKRDGDRLPGKGAPGGGHGERGGKQQTARYGHEKLPIFPFGYIDRKG